MPAVISPLPSRIGELLREGQEMLDTRREREARLEEERRARLETEGAEAFRGFESMARGDLGEELSQFADWSIPDGFCRETKRHIIAIRIPGCSAIERPYSRSLESNWLWVPGWSHGPSFSPWRVELLGAKTDAGDICAPGPIGHIHAGDIREALALATEQYQRLQEIQRFCDQANAPVEAPRLLERADLVAPPDPLSPAEREQESAGEDLLESLSKFIMLKSLEDKQKRAP